MFCSHSIRAACFFAMLALIATPCAADDRDGNTCHLLRSAIENDRSNLFEKFIARCNIDVREVCEDTRAELQTTNKSIAEKLTCRGAPFSAEEDRRIKEKRLKEAAEYQLSSTCTHFMAVASSEERRNKTSKIELEVKVAACNKNKDKMIGCETTKEILLDDRNPWASLLNCEK